MKVKGNQKIVIRNLIYYIKVKDEVLKVFKKAIKEIDLIFN